MPATFSVTSTGAPEGKSGVRGGLKLKCTKSSTDTAHDDELTVCGCMAALSVPQVKARHLQGHLSEAQRGSLVSIAVCKCILQDE